MHVQLSNYTAKIGPGRASKKSLMFYTYNILMKNVIPLKISSASFSEQSCLPATK